jgi:hypothetical protein
MNRKVCRRWYPWRILLASLAWSACAGTIRDGWAEGYLSHPPLRTVRPAPDRPIEPGSVRFADAQRGDDADAGTEERPWRTLRHSLTQLKAGDTLCLREGVFHEHAQIALVGRKDAPITIRSYPGETAVIDGGFREFLESPADAWEPFADGAPDEYVSARAYPNERNVMGSFGDSMIGLNTYFHVMDLRASSELWDWEDWGNTKETDAKPLYCGPGLWYNPENGRIHVRLSRTNIRGISNYRGTTDPREVPLLIAPFRSVPLMVNGARHVRFQDLTLRGGGYDTVVLDYGENIEFDCVTIWCGTYGMRTNRTGPLRFHRSALYGNIPPWLFRSDTSKRAYPGRPHRDITRLNTHSNWVTEAGREFSVFATPVNDNWEISYSEFTDSSDGPYFGGVGIRFHHNLVDNMQDDGLYLSPMYPRHIYARSGADIHIYQNVFRQCLTTFAFGGPEKETADRIFIYRNLVDLTVPVPVSRPTAKEPQSGKSFGKLMGDHGSPPWPTTMIYHNTFILRGPLIGIGGHAHPERPRFIFNNILFHYDRVPEPQVPPPDQGKADGDLYWQPGADPEKGAALLSQYRASKEFQKSKEVYPPGFASRSIVADPRFIQPVMESSEPTDYRLQEGSPAVDAGADVPADWPDPLRGSDPGRPDIGALPLGAEPLKVGR